MMKEDYVSYDQAERLKSLGYEGYDHMFDMYYATRCYCEGNNPYYFDTICAGDLISDPKRREDEYDGWVIDEEYSIPAPTLYQAQKWLRETKNIHLEIRYTSNPQYEPYLGKVVIIENHPNPNTIVDTDTCDTYEEALSSCIDKALDILLSDN